MLKSLALLLTGLLSSVHSAAAQRWRVEGAEIVFLDVGQGDAILVRSDTFAVLIDAGGSNRTYEILDELDVDRLHLAIASHNHRDHIGGMDYVLDSIPVALYVDNGCQESTEAQAYVENAIRNRRTPWRTARDTTFVYGRLKLRLMPSPFWAPSCDSSQNNLSVGVLLEIGKFQALLTGDSETDALNAWLRRGAISPVTLLKAAHHGSRNGVTPGWIAATKPAIVVISVGQPNAYGHPSDWALRYYETGNRRVLRTDRDGAVWICVNADGRYKAVVERSHELSTHCH
jgi:competence protein ComEC